MGVSNVIIHSNPDNYDYRIMYICSSTYFIFTGPLNNKTMMVHEAPRFASQLPKQGTPDPIPLDPPTYRMIYLTVHPAICKYFDIADDKIKLRNECL